MSLEGDHEESGGHRRDRLVMLALLLLILVPSLLYVWGAVRTARHIARRDALLRNLATAQLGAQLTDAQCRTALAVLRSLARRRRLVEALERDSNAQSPGKPGTGANLNIERHLRDAVELVPDIAQVAAYHPDGTLAASYGSPDSPAAAQKLVRESWFYQSGQFKAEAISNVHRLGGPGGVPVVSLAVRVGPGHRPAGFLLAPFRLQVFEQWLKPLRLSPGSVFYLVDSEGRVVASSGGAVRRRLALREYTPVRRALAGEAGSMMVKHSPILQTAALTAFAPAAVPRWGVVVSQSEAAALASADQFLDRFILLTFPILGLIIAAAWSMERMHARQVRLARENLELSRHLARQNEQLRLADHAKSDFLANVSHNLRTPLASIKASISGLLEPDIEWDHDTLRGFLKLVHEEIDRLAAEVRNLLQMARIEAHALPMQKEVCDLAEIVESALERVEPLTREWTVALEMPPEPLLIDADYTQIETVILNLLENAVKYSSSGTTLRLSARRQASAAEGGEEVLFTLQDQGPGVSPEDQERVFEKFHRVQGRASIPGTGLGLAICRAIIQAHGGRIGVRTPAEGGAEFWFSLPQFQGGELDTTGGEDEPGSHSGC